MGIHSSLKVDAAGVQQRSVLTRIERIKELMKKGLWTEERAVTGLPKNKITKIKTKKAKAATAEGATPGAAASGAAAKPEAAAKDKKAPAK